VAEQSGEPEPPLTRVLKSQFVGADHFQPALLVDALAEFFARGLPSGGCGVNFLLLPLRL